MIFLVSFGVYSLKVANSVKGPLEEKPRVITFLFDKFLKEMLYRTLY